MYHLIDVLIILFFLLITTVIIGAIGGIVDAYLDPPCKCAEITRQKRETGGVTL